MAGLGSARGGIGGGRVGGAGMSLSLLLAEPSSAMTKSAGVIGAASVSSMTESAGFASSLFTTEPAGASAGIDCIAAGGNMGPLTTAPSMVPKPVRSVVSIDGDCAGSTGLSDLQSAREARSIAGCTVSVGAVVICSKRARNSRTTIQS